MKVKLDDYFLHYLTHKITVGGKPRQLNVIVTQLGRVFTVTDMAVVKRPKTGRRK